MCLHDSYVCVCSLLGGVWLSVTPWTIAHQAPLSTRFSRQEYGSGLPFPSPLYDLHIIKNYNNWISSTNFSIWENLQLLPSFKNRHIISIPKKGMCLKCIISCLFANMCLLPWYPHSYQEHQGLQHSPFLWGLSRQGIWQEYQSPKTKTQLWAGLEGGCPWSLLVSLLLPNSKRHMWAHFTDAFIQLEVRFFLHSLIRSSSSLLIWYI